MTTMTNNNYATNKLLLKVGVSPDLSGYHYLAEAINMIKETLLNGEVNGKLTMLYRDIGKKFNSTGPRVERSMRHAVEKAFSVNNAFLNEIFDALIDADSNKATNSCFVYTLAQYLIMEEEG